MNRLRTLRLGAVAMLFSTQPRLKERALDDVAVISVPASLKSGRYLGYEEEFARRRPFHRQLCPPMVAAPQRGDVSARQETVPGL